MADQKKKMAMDLVGGRLVRALTDSTLTLIALMFINKGFSKGWGLDWVIDFPEEDAIIMIARFAAVVIAFVAASVFIGLSAAVVSPDGYRLVSALSAPGAPLVLLVGHELVGSIDLVWPALFVAEAAILFVVREPVHWSKARAARLKEEARLVPHTPPVDVVPSQRPVVRT